MERKEYGEEREAKPARSKFMVSNASSICNEMQRVSFLVRGLRKMVWCRGGMVLNLLNFYSEDGGIDFTRNVSHDTENTPRCYRRDGCKPVELLL
jgi:hypothetical protein